ncbi:alcohol dehydrogenase [Penicillium crustosum]|uniref:alcohol dehydrogenase n=1 Tax=Penicillium crustosum TaxID=36656 RepID=UPI00239A1D54|nr:alcohol dehydrogenase [Penicillium crustosum]KAJ5417176.1 alcohol dehydrogenase [Penicillium crustosum]
MRSSSGQRVSSYQVASVLEKCPNFYFETQKLAIPTNNHQEVLVELDVTGFCGTDLSLAHSYLGPCQTILGHEGVGRISAVGSSCPSEAARVGCLVGAGWIRDACGSCRVCDSDIKDKIRRLEQVLGGRNVPGTLVRYTVIPERYITPLPDGVPSEMLAPVMCAGVTGYEALKVANIATGSWVGIAGAAGEVGSLALSDVK